MKKSLILAIFVTILLATPSLVFSIVWPGTGITTANTITMPSPYEPSGVAWNEVSQKLFAVSDPTSDGQNRITMMDADGSNKVTWKSSGDFEALAITDPASNYLYVATENRPTIKEFDVTSPVNAPRFTKTWDLFPWLGDLGNSGIEGMAYIPHGFHPYNDIPNLESYVVFYVGVQRKLDINHATPDVKDDGLIYAFALNKEVATDVIFLGYMKLDYSITPVQKMPYQNISDMYFSKETGTLFVLYDDSWNPTGTQNVSCNYLFEISPDGRYENAQIVNTYTGLPGSGREGIVIKTTPMSSTAEVVIAHDDSPTLTRHFNFPVTLLVTNPDSDGDGTPDSSDCAPHDAGVASVNTFYIDSDRDGLGSTNTQSMCAVSAPQGYATNADDCDDTSPSILGKQNYYRDGDGDGNGIGDPILMCPAVGYVDNNRDTNDRDFDNDGFESGVPGSLVDCDDTNPNIHGPVNYYRDADADGKRFGEPQLMCAASGDYILSELSPIDVNDNDFDNDSIEKDSDCDDHNSSVTGPVNFYMDADHDGKRFGEPQLMCIASGEYILLESNPIDANDHDYDNDGVETLLDCNDTVPTVLGPTPYYIDADSDGLGFGAPQLFCSAPGEYKATIGGDTNDNDYDNDGSITPRDCNDHDNTASTRGLFYQDSDGDGLGNPNALQTACATSLPGYVRDYSDTNDNDFDNDGIDMSLDCDDHNNRIGGPQTYYRDADGDKLGIATDSVTTCRMPIGYTTKKGDRNDNDFDNDGVSPPADPNDKNPKITYWSRTM